MVHFNHHLNKEALLAGLAQTQPDLTHTYLFSLLQQCTALNVHLQVHSWLCQAIQGLVGGFASSVEEEGLWKVFGLVIRRVSVVEGLEGFSKAFIHVAILYIPFSEREDR